MTGDILDFFLILKWRLSAFIHLVSCFLLVGHSWLSSGWGKGHLSQFSIESFLSCILSKAFFASIDMIMSFFCLWLCWDGMLHSYISIYWAIPIFLEWIPLKWWVVLMICYIVLASIALMIFPSIFIIQIDL